MRALRGRYYDGRSARFEDVRLTLDEHGTLACEPPLFEPMPLSGVRISSRIGNTPRRLELPDGSVVEAQDHLVLDDWVGRHRPGLDRAHHFESRASYALAALLCVTAVLVSGALWGVPWISEIVADAVPSGVAGRLGQGTLEYMDRIAFAPSTLEESHRQELSRRLEALLPADSDFDYRIEFRDGGFIGANAFALPDGAIVVTDQLVQLAQDDDEISAVLLHEVGHIEHRHALRIVISHAGLAALTTAIAGDVTAAGTLVLALPNVLMESSYSRQLEWEADSYALERMPELGLNGGKFADFLDRLESTHAAAAGEDLDCGGSGDVTAADLDMNPGPEDGEDVADAALPQSADDETTLFDEEELESDWLSYLSTHPPSAERIARFRNGTK